MASIPWLLFLSLLSHSILFTKCNQDDDLLDGIQQYRASLNLTVLTMTTEAECLADEIADVFMNQSCTTATSSNATTLAAFPGYFAVLTKCSVNATNNSGNSQILPTCVPNQQNLVISNFMSKYASYLNSTQFSTIGVGAEDDWLVVLLTNIAGTAINGASGLTLLRP